MGNVVRGLVPRWGGGGAWQNPPRQFAIPSHNSSFSSLGVPAPAGMSDWYQNALKRLSSAPANPSIRHWCENAPTAASIVPGCHRTRTRRSGSPIRHSREGGNPRTNIPRKNVNRDTTTCVQTATLLRLSGESTPRIPTRRRNPEGCGRCQFSYLGVPAPAGMRDCHESMSRTPIRDNPVRQPLIGHSRHPFVIPAPQFVIPAKAGIQKGGGSGQFSYRRVPTPTTVAIATTGESRKRET